MPGAGAIDPDTGPAAAEAPVTAPPAPRAAPGARAAVPRCAPRRVILDRLATEWGESPVAMGITAVGGLLEVLSSESGSTWTIIVTAPGGATCIVSTGTGWRSLQPVTHDPEA